MIAQGHTIRDGGTAALDNALLTSRSGAFEPVTGLPTQLRAKGGPSKAQLQAKLKALGLPTSGNKPVVQGRLAAYEGSHSISQHQHHLHRGIDNTAAHAAPGHGTHTQASRAHKLQALTVAALRARLRELGLATAGKKPDLLTRLAEYGREAPDAETALRTLTVVALRARLHALGLDTSGRKAALVKRVEEHARRINTGRSQQSSHGGGGNTNVSTASTAPISTPTPVISLARESSFPSLTTTVHASKFFFRPARMGRG
jgi:hypothetical protein